MRLSVPATWSSPIEPGLIPQGAGDLDEPLVVEMTHDAQVEIAIAVEEADPVARGSVLLRGPGEFLEFVSLVEELALRDLAYGSDLDDLPELDDLVEFVLAHLPDPEPPVTGELDQASLASSRTASRTGVTDTPSSLAVAPSAYSWPGRIAPEMILARITRSA